MTEPIWIALISLAGTLLGTFGGILTSGKLTAYRIEQLEKRVDKHNSLIERTYQLETRVQLHDARFQAVDHRIAALHNKTTFNSKKEDSYES